MATWVYGVGVAPWGSILEPQPAWVWSGWRDAHLTDGKAPGSGVCSPCSVPPPDVCCAASCHLHLELPRLSGWTLGSPWHEFISSFGGNNFCVWTHTALNLTLKPARLHVLMLGCGDLGIPSAPELHRSGVPRGWQTWFDHFRCVVGDTCMVFLISCCLNITHDLVP